MSTITETIKPYLSPNESIRAARANNASAVVVTDRRVMEVKRGSGSRGRDLQLAKSTLITGPKILGVKVVEAGSEPVDTRGILRGIASFVIGFLIFAIAGAVGGELAGLANMFGLAAIVLGGLIGVWFVWTAIQTQSGSVMVKLIGDEGRVVETISLAEAEADVAAEISSVIGERN